MEDMSEQDSKTLDIEKITNGLETVTFEVGSPFELDQSYLWMITYTYPGPLSCLSGIQRGCSPQVYAGSQLGYGRFCNYSVLCAGTTVTILFNEFQRIG